MEHIHDLREFMLKKPLLIGALEKPRYIYDKDMPHLSYEIDEVHKGDCIIALIVDNRLDSTSNPRLVLSIQNSKILRCK